MKPFINNANRGALVRSLQSSLNSSAWGGHVPPRYRHTIVGNAGQMRGFGNNQPPAAQPPTTPVTPSTPSQWAFQPNPLDQGQQPQAGAQPPQAGMGQSPWAMNPPVYPWMMNPAAGGWGQMYQQPQIGGPLPPYDPSMQQQQPPQMGGPGPAYNPQQSYGWGQYY